MCYSIHNLYTNTTRMINTITGINHNEASTPSVYATDKIKRIPVKNVITSLYFMPHQTSNHTTIQQQIQITLLEIT